MTCFSVTSSGRSTLFLYGYIRKKCWNDPRCRFYIYSAQKYREFTSKKTFCIKGTKINYQILGDAAYPLLPWLLKPYASRGITAEQESFNAYMNSGRVCVDIAFGRLKTWYVKISINNLKSFRLFFRWWRLLKRYDGRHLFAPHIVADAVVSII